MSHTSLVSKPVTLSDISIEQKRVYPSPLPALKIRPEIDENKFTLMDKATLRQAWRLVMPFHVRLGRKTFYSYLIANETLINKFRDSQGKIMLRHLHNHGRMVMNLFDQIINNYLDKPNELHTKLDESMPKHLEHGIDTDTLIDVVEKLKAYLLSSVHWANQKSHRLETAVGKLFNIVASYNQQQEMRHRTTTHKYSMLQSALQEL